MAQSRIRYVKTDKDGILKSIKNYTTETSQYSITIDTNEVTYSIKNLNSGRKYEGGEDINNLHVLKRHVKARLEKLGVDFEGEIRDNSTRVAGKNCSYKKGD